MRSNKTKVPPRTTRPKVEARAPHSSASEKTFLLRAFVQWLWSQRRPNYTDLFTAIELAELTGFSPVHLARELHRVGAQPVPRANCRKRKGYFHKPMPQVWLLSDGPIPDYLSTATDAWEEYMLQRIVHGALIDYTLKQAEALRIAREIVLEAVPDRQ